MKLLSVKKGDTVLLLCLAAVAVAVCLFYVFGAVSPQNGVVEITQDGTLYATYPLSADRTDIITAKNSGQNTLVIENGTAYIQHATCPDGLCTKQGKISHRGEAVVCLPHGLVITVKDGKDADVDFTVK